MSTVGAVTEDETVGMPDLKQVFDEWVSGLKQAILAQAQHKHDPAGIAAALGMSEKALVSVLVTMVKEGSIQIVGIQPRKQEEKE